MSAQELRNVIILENIPKLIKSLTGFEETEENFHLCEQFAFAKIRNHKHISVNSHEIRRRIDGLAERFTISNYKKYADRLLHICDAFIKHPLCESHYEVDIQWCILQFLLDTAFNPLSAITDASNKSILNDDIEDDDASTVDSQDYLVQLLKTDNITDGISYGDTGSELSNWTDSEEEHDEERAGVNSNELIKSTTLITNDQLQGIQPPKKKPHYQYFDGSNSEKWLLNNVQNSWWLTHDTTNKIKSEHPEANFCHLWNEHSSNKHGKKKISTVSEYCLIREIIWMFIKPNTCKFFIVEGDTVGINITNNASINSTSLNGLQSFLQNFTYYMTIILKLKLFSKMVIEPEEIIPPHSYECYVEGLNDCLQPFTRFLLEKEKEVMKQTVFSNTDTILQLQKDMLPYFQLLDYLYKIHLSSTLDYKVIPAHICSSHLISALLAQSSTGGNVAHSNLASSLFLVSVKVYLHIIDTWWTEGRLEDWNNEFMIKKSVGKDEIDLVGFEKRLLSKNQEECFYISSSISNIIENNSFIKLLSSHSLQAGYALNILYALDKISDIKDKCRYQENLYTIFLKIILNKLSKFQYENEDAKQNGPEKITIETLDPENNSISQDNTITNSFRQELLNENELLYMVFEESLNIVEQTQMQSKIDETIESKSYTAYDLFEQLNNITPVHLPFEQIVLEVLTQLLETRISVANDCVMKMYKEEYQILQHFQYLRRVYLLEASDLMHHFYSNLFKQIESGENWNNPYLLTVQLNGILCSKFPDMNSLFNIQILAKSYKEKNVQKVIKYFSISYVIGDSLRDIITEKCLTEYNQVFRFLLKIKWGLWTLENLRFPNSFKRRPPYVELNATDLTFKRLALVRNWILYSIQCIHSHLMTQVLQLMGQKLNEKIENAKTLIEIIAVHNSYIQTIYDHCFQTTDDDNIRTVIEQFLNLITALRDEWENICYIKEVLDGDASDVDQADSSNVSQIDDIESTYIHCHCAITDVLNLEVYSKNRSHLSGLLAAFNCSCPF